MDSMVGYKNEKYLHFGRYAAKMDDVWNYIPSRISALLMIASAWIFRMDYKRAWAVWKRDRRKHASPNSGFPESAMAGILDCRFGGAHVYHGLLVEKPYIGDNDREISYADFRIAVRVNHMVTLLTVVSIVAVYLCVFIK